MLTQGLKRSLQRELNTFYQKLQKGDFLSQYVTKGAFSRARAKLDPRAFIELNRTGTESFYQEAPWQKWNDFRILSCDASTVRLPNHPSVIEKFGRTGYGSQADSLRSLARISLLYDVLNYIPLDGQISSMNAGERALLVKHLPRMVPGQDLLLLDRGYPGMGLFFQLQALGIDYCARMQEGRWLAVRQFLQAQQVEKEVSFHLPDTEQQLKDQYPDVPHVIHARLIKVRLADGSIQVFCTSVPREKLDAASFGDLYRLRWNIEEGFKLYKSRMGLEAFSGKTALSIEQDFHAGIFMMTTAAVMAFPVAEEVKRQHECSKHPRKINRTNTLALIRETAVQIFAEKLVEPLLDTYDRILRATTEIFRPNRTFERKKIRKKPPSSNYKIL